MNKMINSTKKKIKIKKRENIMITLTQMQLIRQVEEYDENKLFFWLICHILLFLSLINLNMYIINTC